MFKTEPTVSIGIMAGQAIAFYLNGNFNAPQMGRTFSGNWAIRQHGERIILEGDKQTFTISDGFTLEPVTYKEAWFELKNVTIGIDFHWERQENQQFKGSLKFIVENGSLTAVNMLQVEDYLKSVISSEMSAQSPVEFLKAHAVISRSWLLAQMEKRGELQSSKAEYSATIQTENEYIKWFDREDHDLYDVCADDHCQRYQGITKVTAPEVDKAVEGTRGKVLTYNNAISDARFSKACGGITETFENVWENKPKPYLQKVVDNYRLPEGYDLNLKREDAAREWIMNEPEAFCNTRDKDLLSSLLPDFDQETHDFFRWRREFTQQELAELIARRMDMDFGEIKDLVPVERGESGRLVKLRIEGTKKQVTIGKELIIRKALSESHLYSSAFVVEKLGKPNKLPEKFILYGAGWGHGAGLCQIGAGRMGAGGYSYKNILTHYFKGAQINPLYK